MKVVPGRRNCRWTADSVSLKTLMARFLFSCWSFPGHFYPSLAVALALRAQGHECAFYSGPRAARVLQDENIPHFAFRNIDEDTLYEIVFGSEHARSVDWRGTPQFIKMGRQWMLDTIPQQVTDLQQAMADWRPDVLITDPTFWGPLLVLWEKYEIPVAILTIGCCMLPGPDAPPFGLGLPPPRNWHTRLLSWVATRGTDIMAAGFRRHANEIRRQYGLPPLETSVTQFTGTVPLYLVPCTPEFDYQRRDLPPSVHYVGPCVWTKPRHEPPADWLQQLPHDRPWVHATEGTIHVQEPLVLRAAAQGLANLPMYVILSTGGNREPADLNIGPIAPNVRAVRWVSHSELLPQLDLMITTGGAATTLATLAAGVPMIIIPTEWDKPEMAQRAVATGAALRLSPKNCSPARLRAAVEHILSTPSFRQNARRMAEIFARYRGPAAAAELLEELAGLSRDRKGALNTASS